MFVRCLAAGTGKAKEGQRQHPQCRLQQQDVEDFGTRTYLYNVQHKPLVRLLTVLRFLLFCAYVFRTLLLLEELLLFLTLFMVPVGIPARHVTALVALCVFF